MMAACWLTEELDSTDPTFVASPWYAGFGVLIIGWIVAIAELPERSARQP